MGVPLGMSVRSVVSSLVGVDSGYDETIFRRSTGGAVLTILLDDVQKTLLIRSEREKEQV